MAWIAPTVVKRSGGTTGLNTDVYKTSQGTFDIMGRPVNSGDPAQLKTAQGQVTAPTTFLPSMLNTAENASAATAQGQVTAPSPSGINATTPAAQSTNQYLPADMLSSAQNVTRQMMSGDWTADLRTQNNEATARNLANQRAATAQQLNTAGLSNQGIGVQAAQGVEQAGLQSISDAQLKTAIAEQDAKQQGVQNTNTLLQAGNALNQSSIDQGYRNIQALINAGGSSNIAAASTAFENLTGLPLDLTRFSSQQQMADYMDNATNAATMLQNRTTFSDPVMQNSLKQMWAQSGGQGEPTATWMKTTYDNLKMSGNAFDVANRTIDESTTLSDKDKSLLKKFMLMSQNGTSLGISLADEYGVYDSNGKIIKSFTSEAEANSYVNDNAGKGYTSKATGNSKIVVNDLKNGTSTTGSTTDTGSSGATVSDSEWKSMDTNTKWKQYESTIPDAVKQDTVNLYNPKDYYDAWIKNQTPKSYDAMNNNTESTRMDSLFTRTKGMLSYAPEGSGVTTSEQPKVTVMPEDAKYIADQIQAGNKDAVAKFGVDLNTIVPGVNNLNSVFSVKEAAGNGNDVYSSSALRANAGKMFVYKNQNTGEYERWIIVGSGAGGTSLYNVDTKKTVKISTSQR